MDYKAIAGKIGKGALSGALASITVLKFTGHLNEAGAWKAIGGAILSAAIHGGWEAYNQTKA